MKNGLLAFAAISMLALSMPASAADNTIEVGTLLCEITDQKNIVVYSNETLACTFNPASGANEKYSGTITSYGIDLEIKLGQKLIWTVFSATKENLKGALAGKYVGASASAAFGAAVGAKVLVGGSKKSITLQPLSLAGGAGFGAGVGIQEFVLKAM